MSPQAPDKKSAAQQVLAQRVLARRRLLYFITLTHPAYLPGWVHHDICARLERFSQAVAEQKSPRLMLLCPPRLGKSEAASIRFPAWHLGHNPMHEIINVGYNLDLPMRFSRRVREIVRDPVYPKIFPDTALDPDSSAAEAWNTTTGGGFTAAGVGGGITGKGAHILIIDDPLKNQEEADNPETREKLDEWYQSTAYTRLAPGGGVLVIQTRWNDDDLAGRLGQRMHTDAGADQFEIVSYPALAELYEWRHPETLHLVRTEGAEPPDGGYELLREPGEAVHPARYDVDALMRIKANLHPRVWSALYQQNPVPDEGMYFQKEYFRYAKSFPDMRHTRIYTAWDFAIGEKQTNDWTVGATLMQDQADCLHVLDVHRIKADSFAIVEAILNVADRWGQIPETDYLLGFEDGQIFKAIKPLLEKRMSERKTYPSYEVMKPLTDKHARARPLQGRMQQGRVYFPESASWTAQAVQEMLRFPAGTHDDVVDALAWAARLCMGKAPPAPPQGVRLPSWRDQLEIDHAVGSHMSA